jgi:hypothetical protein
MKWSQQNNTSKHNYFIGTNKYNSNYAKERKDNKIDPEEEYKHVISIHNHTKQAIPAAELLSNEVTIKLPAKKKFSTSIYTEHCKL